MATSTSTLAATRSADSKNFGQQNIRLIIIEISDAFAALKSNKKNYSFIDMFHVAICWKTTKGLLMVHPVESTDVRDVQTVRIKSARRTDLRSSVFTALSRSSSSNSSSSIG